MNSSTKASPDSFFGAGAGRRQVRILFTCAGRRIELISGFIRAARRLGLRIQVHVADTEALVAAACVADRAHTVPSADAGAYIPSLLKVARRERIDLVIPLLDVELLKLALARGRFARFGCHVIVSSPRVVRRCRDKLALYRDFTARGIDVPRTWTPDEIRARRRHAFPYFLKPRKGSASQGNFVLRQRADLDAFVPRVADAIIQEYVAGDEYTLDVYAGDDGRPRCVVPRRRLEVRGGEVTKAVTVRHEGIMATGVRVVEALAECRGLITVQLFLTPEGRIKVIEVNPRFGGGVPLAIHAGADIPRWLLSEWLGRRPRIRLDHFREGVAMLRYHESFFRENAATTRGRIARRR